MQYLPIIFTVALIHLLVVMAPGPDFIMIMRNSLAQGRRAGIYSAVGIGLGILVHVSYCLVGLAYIISKSILLFSIIKYIGAAYLLYVGFKSLRAQPTQQDSSSSLTDVDILTKTQSIRNGFITNVTNPKATLFFLSLFTLVIKSSTPLFVKIVMGGEMSIVTMLWFSLVAVLISHKAVRKSVSKFQHWAERCMGGVLILFSIKLASEHLK